ncbi:protein of unknown function [Candidatus Methylomirabilis oxygeniifera]|uniref:Uncharacterized protein n=1 Tax=Methylomirabilis oxygeniifera TaxID=671143 RepID=D5MHJ4_METO1|nr:protein of unknown function [Candidatus Methylomirabilis oxyfera]
MAIAISLDDRHQLCGGFQQPSDGGYIVADRLEIDLDPGTMGQGNSTGCPTTPLNNTHSFLLCL